MLIKHYSSQLVKTPCHTPLDTEGPYSFQYKGLTCYFDPDLLSSQSHTPQELDQLFNKQLIDLEKEIKIHQQFKLNTQAALKQIRQQYNDLFFYEQYTYQKSALLDGAKEHHRKTNTHVFEPSLIEPSTPNTNNTNQTQEDDTIPDFIFKKHSSLPNTIGISTQSIRNLTGYSYTVQMPWHTTPQRIGWQEVMLTDQSNLLVIDGSRQMWKSYGIAELLIEESFVPGADILVAAFLQKTTNAILNYMRSFLQNFSQDDFTVYKKDWYIQNNTSNTKIHFRTLSDEGQNVLGLTLRLVVIDEAQHPSINREIIENVIKPTMTTTWGRLILIGTAIENISSYMYESIIDIAKGTLYNWPEQKTARHVKVSAYDNPLIHPLERKEIMDRLDSPAIQRQYMNKWGKWEDSLMSPPTKSINNLPPPSTEGHIIHTLDPARQKDRSAYAIGHCLDNHLTVLVSDEVPAELKADWNTQAQFQLKQSTHFKTTYASYSSLMDVTGVGDAVATIFRENNFYLTHQVKYTSGSNKSQPMPWYYHVAKHLLLNNLLDMLEAKQITIISETNQKLIEEMNYASIEENRFGTLSLQSKFFDDILNCLMTMAWIAKEERYLYRQSFKHTETSRSHELFLDEMRTYAKRANSSPLNNKNHKRNW